MSNAHDLDGKYVFDHFVDDPVVTHADDTTKAVSDAAFELSLTLLLDECERRGKAQSRQ